MSELIEFVAQTPVPLTVHRTTPAFPIDALPEPVAAMVSAVAEFTQTDPGMAGTSALTMLAACAGGRCEIEARPGWREPLNIYSCTVANPAERKSAVQAEMSAPLMDVEQELVDKVEPKILEKLTQRDILDRRAEAAKRRAAGPKRTPGDDAEAYSAAKMAEAITVPTIPRILADDATPEAVASLLAEQNGRLAIISAEGGIFDVIAGRYSGNIPNLDVFLKAHAGDRIRIDRKSRSPEFVKRPALTMGLMIQPEVLGSIARNRTFRGRGLLARFLYSQPPSMVGRREIETSLVSDEVRAEYASTVRTLARTMHEWTDPAVLTLEPDAADALTILLRRVEPTLGPGGELETIRDWGGKLVGATVRIAGLIHLGDNPTDGWRRPVPRSVLVRAIRLIDYFIEHAKAALAAMGVDEVTVDAEYLLGVIVKNAERWPPSDDLPEGYYEITTRTIHMRASRSRFPKVGDLEPALERLVQHGYLLPVDATTANEKQARQVGVRKPGRRPSQRWAVNPHATATETTENT